MELLLAPLLIVLDILCPAVGVLTSALVIILSKRKFTIVIISLCVTVGYIGSYYLPNLTDDMTRYIYYMNAVSGFSFGGYLHQLFGANPISVSGLTGAQWPGSAIVLYINSQLGNYRWISGITLGLVVLVRLLPISHFFEYGQVSEYWKPLMLLIVSVAWIRPVLPLSGFRWFLAISVLMFVEYLEIKNGSKVQYMFLYILGISFHPGALVFVVLRLFSIILASSNKVKLRGLVIVGIGIATLMFSRVRNYVLSLFDSFSEYSDNSISKSQEVINILLIIILVLILIKFILVAKDSLLRSADLHYAKLLIYFNLVMYFISPTFDRYTQFTIPMLIILLSYELLNSKKWSAFDFAVIGSIFGVGAVVIINAPYLSFPRLFEPISRVLFTVMH